MQNGRDRGDRQAIDEIRRFNRFYTTQLGVLQDGWMDSPFSLTEVRVLYEIAHQDRPTAADLIKMLHLDGGYLSRILQRFAKRRLITRTTSDTDARQTHLALSARGRESLAPLEQLAREQVAAMLDPLAPGDRHRVIEAMRAIHACLDATPTDPDRSPGPGPGHDSGPGPNRRRAEPAVASAHGSSSPPPFTLRTHQPGDIGWIVEQHGALYTREYQWDSEFEALVAEIAAHFLRHFDPARERCWIAERDGVRIGTVMLVKESDEVAKLRLLLVDPAARGLGVGKRLVDECVRFAREAGYRRITLWTQASLLAARGIYQAAGFHVVREWANHSFGHDLISETWELNLRTPVSESRRAARPANGKGHRPAERKPGSEKQGADSPRASRAKRR
jgi:DNA-binding MarR family transcriptional regulator/GNAT superfamily N-acetyltransferase